MKIPVEQLFPERVLPFLDELRKAENPRSYLFDNVNLPVRYLNLLYGWIKAGMPSFGFDDFGAPITPIRYGGGSMS